MPITSNRRRALSNHRRAPSTVSCDTALQAASFIAHEVGEAIHGAFLRTAPTNLPQAYVDQHWGSELIGCFSIWRGGISHVK
jgi:hypothetical protein